MAAGAMRVTVFTTMPPGVYSGGRYLSLMLAYALARAGAQVTYVTNNLPLFDGDFAPYEQDWPVRKVVGAAFALPDDLVSDWVVVIPTGSFDSRFYNAALDHARQSGARVALLSFETPNWYNALSPFPRSPMPTEAWRQVVARGGLVLAIAAEGVEPARRYFGEGTEGAQLAFGHWHPPINDLAAARAEALEGEVPPDLRRRVTMFARIEDPHKGAQDLLRLPPDLFEGHLLSLVFGRGVPEPYVDALRRHFAPARDFAIEVHSRISDEAKFRLLARSRLLLFPSYFEGFGYPPVEAAWMGVPTVAYDLPLLREVAGGAVRPVPVGDAAAFAEAVRAALAGPPGDPLPRSLLAEPPDTLSAGHRLLAMLEDAQDRVVTASAPPAAVPIARTPLAEDAAMRALVDRHRAGLHLLEAQGDVFRGAVRLHGRVAGAEAQDRLRLSLAGSVLPVAPLRRLPDGTFAFDIEGVIEHWPDSGGTVTADCVLLRAQGHEGVALGGIAVRADWPILLERSAGSRLVSASLPEARFAVDPARLASDPIEAAALAEMSEALRRRGWRTRALLPEDAPGPASFPMLDADLLPRMDRVDLLPRVAIASLLAAGGESGLAVVGSGFDLPEGREGLRLLLREGDGSAPRQGPVVLSAGLEAGTRAVSLDARLARRSLAEAGTEAVVLLLPADPITDLPPSLLRTLRAVEPWADRLRLIVPRRLWGGGAPPTLGATSAVEVLPEAELAHAVRLAGRAAGIAMGGGDEAGAVLLRSLGWPILREDDAALQTALHAAIEPPALPEGSLGRLLAELLPPPAGPRLIDRLALDRGQREPRGSTPSPPLRLGAGDILSLSNTLHVPAGLLVSGWRDRDMYGARMSDGAALLAFGVLQDRPTVGWAIEMLLRITGKPEPGLVLWVFLNGQPLGKITRVPAGVSSHVLPIPRRAWSEAPLQGLVLARDQPRPADADSAVTLMALSLMGPAGKVPAWPAAGAPSESRAPLAPPISFLKGDAQSCRFGKGSAPGFAQLLAGWSIPEDEMVWSDGTIAALGFQPPLASGPVLLRLDGQAFLPPGVSGREDAQRIRLRMGRSLLGTAVMDQTRSSLSVIVPDMLAGRGADHLLVEFPDARRPADLGLGEDARLLGLALRGAEAMPLTQQVARLEGLEKNKGPWRVTLPAVPGALRVLGAGPPPAGLRLGGPDGKDFAAPVATVDGGWEAWVVLEPACLARDTVAVGLLGGSVRPQVVELWSGTERAEAAGELRLVLFEAPELTSDDDIGALLSGWQDAAALAVAEAAATLPLRFDLTTAGTGSANRGLLAEGWSVPEPVGTWSDGSLARLALPAPVGPALARFDLSGFAPAGHGEQQVIVSFDGQLVSSLRVGPPAIVTLAIPDKVRNIEFALPDALSPSEAGLSADSRHLGILLRGLSIESPNPAPLVLADPDGLPRGPAGIHVELVGYLDDRVVLRLSGKNPAPWGLASAPDGPIVHPRPAADGGWEAFMVLSGEGPPPAVRTLAPPLSAPEAFP